MRILMAIALTLMTSLAAAADLTSKDVQLWINSMPDIDTWLNEHEDKLPELGYQEEDASLDAMFKRGMQDLKKAGLYDEFNAKVKKAGFSSVDQWVEVSSRISLTYMALETEDNQQISASQLEAQLKEIRESDLPAEQKAAMEQMMAGSLMVMKAISNVSDADKAAVRPHREELAKQFEAEE
ncbi:hypothetical protein ACQUQU_09465 [Thalassolituus sp. LLYu03]|uniref:hypothetical protein n=1 Tax=Thalassolituus sp. LLYu03 TaxID=3421656 RepID=UPI003D27C33C